MPWPGTYLTAPVLIHGALNLSVWLLAAALLLPVIGSLEGWSPGNVRAVVLSCIAGAFSTGGWTVLVLRRRSSRSGRATLWKLALLLLGSLVVTAIATALKVIPVPRMLVTLEGPQQLSIPLQFLRTWALIGPIHLLYGAATAALVAREALSAREIALITAQQTAQTAQLAALRAQVNPHFLFNALNTATALIELQRPADARTLLLRLGDFFRSSLDSNPAPFSSLQEEFDAVEAYLQIEMARFGDRLRLDVSLPDELRFARIPTALLQPLAENAVRHGAAQAEGIVTVSLAAGMVGDRLLVVVEDDAALTTRQAAHTPGAGIGLPNIAARLHAHYGELGTLAAKPHASGFRAEIVLPLETMEA